MKKPINNAPLVAIVEAHAKRQGVKPAKLAQKAGYCHSAWSGWKLNKNRMKPDIVDELLAIKVPEAVRRWMAL